MNNKQKVKIATAIAGTGLLLDSLFLEKYFFKTKTYHIGYKRGTRSLKIIHLTDLHLGGTLWPYYKKIAATINDIAPDIILITGDVLDKYADNLDAATQFFSLLRHRIVKVAIPGNHDHQCDVPIRDLKKMLAQHNCDLLVNETRIYKVAGTELAITGLDDFIKGYDDFKTAVKDVERHKNHLLLVHSPLQQESVLKELEAINNQRTAKERLNISYILAGHIHGGQVTLFGHAAILPKQAGNYLKGWYNKKPPFLYVSQGVGTSTLPFRFMCRSEIVLFHYQY